MNRNDPTAYMRPLDHNAKADPETSRALERARMPELAVVEAILLFRLGQVPEDSPLFGELGEEIRMPLVPNTTRAGWFRFITEHVSVRSVC